MEDESSSCSWKGVPISELRCDFKAPQYPPVISSEEHVVLVKTPVTQGEVPECFPPFPRRTDNWDKYHVKLPSSEKSTEDENSRWAIIREALSSVILSSQQLEEAIFAYNKRYAEHWNFANLRSFFDEVCEEEDTAMFFQALLPKIIDLALCLPEMITAGVPLLRQGRKRSVTLSQVQVASLLANAFLVTFPHRNTSKKGSEYANYPTINFSRLFQTTYPRNRKEANFEKLRCITNYFRRVTSKAPTGVITFSRHFIPDLAMPRWWESTKLLPRLHVSSEGIIEEDGLGLLQMDFAHKRVGGGVIASGCVQEEIRFVINPELIVSRLFTECLGDNEALIITGCERFNSYSGYGQSFEWAGDYVDKTPSDQYGRKYCTILALDALFLKQNPVEQYTPQNMCRELNKAYVGFSWGNKKKKEELCGIATGNWGCGVYKGNVELKSLIQLMAAAEANRGLAYFTFGDEELRDSMYSLHEYLVQNSIPVGRIYKLLCQYNAQKLYNSVGIFEFVKNEAVPDTRTFHEANDASSSEEITPFRIPKLAVTKRAFCYRTAKAKSGGTSQAVEFDRTDDDGIEEELDFALCKVLDSATSEMKGKEAKVLFEEYSQPGAQEVDRIPDTDEESFEVDSQQSCNSTRMLCDETEEKEEAPVSSQSVAEESRNKETEDKQVAESVLNCATSVDGGDETSTSRALDKSANSDVRKGSRSTSPLIKLSKLKLNKSKLKLNTRKRSSSLTIKKCNDKLKRKISDYFDRKS